MRHLLIALALALPMAAVASDNDIDKINGDIRVEAGQTVGELSTVNGDITLADGASARKADTVNGGITLGERATVGSVNTVNGGIELQAGAKVNGEIEAVNGRIELARGAEVSGHVSNVNGRIELDAAHVAGGLETVDGDIAIGANSRVEGGILVEKPNGGWFHHNRTPHIVIGPHAVVQGTLDFRREVVLQVSDSAQIGPVKGATPVKFSGAQP
jgi:acyl-[acyl carrier protein]--UDP-N-acetylglucosamine O-acyltransferase